MNDFDLIDCTARGLVAFGLGLFSVGRRSLSGVGGAGVDVSSDIGDGDLDIVGNDVDAVTGGGGCGCATAGTNGSDDEDPGPGALGGSLAGGRAPTPLPGRPDGEIGGDSVLGVGEVCGCGGEDEGSTETGVDEVPTGGETGGRGAVPGGRTRAGIGTPGPTDFDPGRVGGVAVK